MDNLTPITREEMLLNDEPLTPITREEKILAGEDLNPVTRREYFLKKYRHAGGDVMVEGLSVTTNGTYTAPEGKAYSPVEVAVPLPENAYLLKTASGSLVSFSDGADLPMPSFICNIDAVQDLHGYDHPWVGGAEKNKLPMTVDGIKAANTSGTWSGNAYTANGVTFKIQTDYDSNVIGIIIDTNGGTASADVIFYLSADGNRGFSLLQGASYIVTADGATNNVGVRIGDSTDAYVGMVKPNPLTFTADSSNTARIEVNNGLSISNITIKPMIRLATETDATFAPYSNICPISGHTGVDAWVRGKNLLDITTITIDGFTFIEDIDGYVSASPNNSDNRTWSYDKSQYKLIIPAGDWKLVIETKNPTSANSRGIIIRDSANNTIRELWADSYNSVGIKTINFTLTEKTNIGIMTKMYDAVARFMIVPQSASNDFEFYNFDSQTIQVSWQTEAGEVFGGYVDLVSGVLTANKSYINVTDESQIKSFVVNANNGSYAVLATNGKIDNSNAMCICNMGVSISFNDRVNSLYVDKDRCYTDDLGRPMIRATNTVSITTATEMFNRFNGLQFAYELETPITYQLTPTQIKSLLGNNNAWCSTGDVDIDYFAKEV